MTSTADDSILSQLDESRRQFLALVNDVRPDLHRYCARMTGSIPDGKMLSRILSLARTTSSRS